MISQIRAYYQATETIATSGQPVRQQFSEIADAGYTTVINLALPNSTNAMKPATATPDSVPAHVVTPIEGA